MRVEAKFDATVSEPYEVSRNTEIYRFSISIFQKPAFIHIHDVVDFISAELAIDGNASFAASNHGVYRFNGYVIKISSLRRITKLQVMIHPNTIFLVPLMSGR